MKIGKLLLTGCILSAGFALIKWAMPRYEEIEMAFSEPLSDGNYIVECGDNSNQIKIRKGKVYGLR